MEKVDEDNSKPTFKAAQRHQDNGSQRPTMSGDQVKRVKPLLRSTSEVARPSFKQARPFTFGGGGDVPHFGGPSQFLPRNAAASANLDRPRATSVIGRQSAKVPLPLASVGPSGHAPIIPRHDRPSIKPASHATEKQSYETGVAFTATEQSVEEFHTADSSLLSPSNIPLPPPPPKSKPSKAAGTFRGIPRVR